MRRRADQHASVRFPPDSPRGNASKTGRRYGTGALRNRWIISMNGQDRTIRRGVLSPCSPRVAFLAVHLPRCPDHSRSHVSDDI